MNLQTHACMYMCRSLTVLWLSTHTHVHVHIHCTCSRITMSLIFLSGSFKICVWPRIWHYYRRSWKNETVQGVCKGTQGTTVARFECSMPVGMPVVCAHVSVCDDPYLQLTWVIGNGHHPPLSIANRLQGSILSELHMYICILGRGNFRNHANCKRMLCVKIRSCALRETSNQKGQRYLWYKSGVVTCQL